MMKEYELLTITSKEIGDKDKAEHYIETLKNIIENVGGNVVDEDFWGEKKFAYKIQGQESGYYAVTDFNGKTKIIQEMKKDLNEEENLLRYLITIKE